MRWLSHYTTSTVDDQTNNKYVSVCCGKKILIRYKRAFRTSVGIGMYFVADSQDIYDYHIVSVTTFADHKPIMHVDHYRIQTTNTEIRFDRHGYTNNSEITINSKKFRMPAMVAKQCFGRLKSYVADDIDRYRRFQRRPDYTTTVNKFPIEILKQARGISEQTRAALDTFMSTIRGIGTYTRSKIYSGGQYERAPDAALNIDAIQV